MQKPNMLQINVAVFTMNCGLFFFSVQICFCCQHMHSYHQIGEDQMKCTNTVALVFRRSCKSQKSRFCILDCKGPGGRWEEGHIWGKGSIQSQWGLCGTTNPRPWDPFQPNHRHSLGRRISEPGGFHGQVNSARNTQPAQKHPAPPLYNTFQSKTFIVCCLNAYRVFMPLMPYGALHATFSA